MLADSEATVGLKAVHDPIGGLFPLILLGEGRRQHGLLALPPAVHILLIQGLGETDRKSVV